MENTKNYDLEFRVSSSSSYFANKPDIESAWGNAATEAVAESLCVLKPIVIQVIAYNLDGYSTWFPFPISPPESFPAIIEKITVEAQSDRN